ncbi:MAG: lysine--tRNA ligase [Deltaproteobacteria bacterium]|nr:lysine--tRNA ligase [Deltaproteobacteria bacterium]
MPEEQAEKEESELLKKRREKIESLKADGIDLYPNDARVADTTASVSDRFGPMAPEELEKVTERFTLAGRLMAVRDFGKGAFISIQDRKGRLQAFIRKNQVGEKTFALFKRLDIGDIVWLAGRVFKTRTGELTIDVQENGLRLLSKSLHSLPEKWHGLTDVEIRYRRRHLDLIVNPEVRKVFHLRSRIISLIRRFMEERDFLEVETPMMQPKAGGAVARPFKTFHNALGMSLVLRIAPELYLKRLITGGLERVFEINRNFRNEGTSTFHNPEFTMMEFYQAYATYEDLMTMTEELFVFVVRELFASHRFSYQGKEIDLTPPWRRLTVRDAVVEIGDVDPAVLDDAVRMAGHARKLGIEVKESDPPGKVLMAIFDETVEKNLVQPTFVTHYPVDVSPLSRRNAEDPSLADRFELYICGKEIANAFSELNDPVDQRGRFEMQLKEREAGDLEAHEMDEDYIGALECGMPPTAGEGIGIDRLVMLLTDSASIRDVILFPLLRTRDE